MAKIVWSSILIILLGLKIAREKVVWSGPSSSGSVKHMATAESEER
jgi:hypothetical protein